MTIALTPRESAVMYKISGHFEREVVEADLSKDTVADMLVVLIAAMLMGGCEGNADLARGNADLFRDKLIDQINWLEEVGPETLQ